ncbi:BHLH domain-containing protein [Mycena venus]|uniref:BHLH domain-containing protein n=1 Tax=Mycena venus TaxID=2733690 RepID=A0A8H6X7Z1_9AGAR|nr:BHLH domain-containing protein [Mycena venus]
MSTLHVNTLPSPMSSASDASSNVVSIASPWTPLSPISPANLDSTLNFVNLTEEEAMVGLTSLRADKHHSTVKTPERRATHNAVERRRREDLTRRIFDLAALLNIDPSIPPTRATIVNIAITHLHAARRHRILAAQELRRIQNEAEALRREVNEWRVRAGVVCFNEPLRSEAFGAVLRGELDLDVLGMPNGGEAEDRCITSGVDGVHRCTECAVYADECMDKSPHFQQPEDPKYMPAETESSFAQHVVHPSASTAAIPLEALQSQPEAPLAYNYSSLPTVADPSFSNVYHHIPHPRVEGGSVLEREWASLDNWYHSLP